MFNTVCISEICNPVAVFAAPTSGVIIACEVASFGASVDT
jgi:hypothetical protein